jgi:hypothetical protein
MGRGFDIPQWYIEPLAHGILDPYPWYIKPSVYGILNPLLMVYRAAYSWYSEPSTNGILCILSLE